MTIRTKLTLWYAAVLFASLILCGALLYNEWVLEPAREHPKAHHENTREGMRDLKENLLISFLPAAIFGLGGGWLLTRKILSPISELTEAAGGVDDANLSVRLPRSNNGDELDQLTAVFNEMIQRLDTSFKRIREFTLHASHELKTPLTIMRAGMESALREEGLSAQMKEQLQDEIDEIDRLTKIVDGLTLLTKADSSLVKLGSEPVQFEQLVEEIYLDGQILAEPYGVSLSLEANEPALVTGDANRLRQLLLNLVDNAVKYNRPNGMVTLDLRQVDGVAKLTISNTGESLSDEQLKKVFEPFFRGDAAHSRDVDGCGLGLAIARWIITSHGGSISMSRSDDQTIVSVHLPAMNRTA